MADEKKIVLSIETITDQSVMEAYGKTLDEVLGAYEDNIALITQYNNQIKANEAAIKAIQKEGERWGKLTAKQSQAIANLTSENGKLKQAKSELVQVTKNQEKIDTSMTGTMQNQSQILGKLRMAWRMMSDEQKKANPEMLKTIQQLDKHLKDSDASIGNFQRNVGNYKSAIEGLTQKFPALGGAISKFAGPTGVVGLATGAFNVLKSAMLSTQTTGDAIEREAAAWQGTWDRFLRMIATADFSNFISQLKGARDAARELADVRDEMFEKENSIRLLKAKQSVEEQKLLRTMRDQTKSEKERIAAGQRYQELVIDNAELQKKAYEALAEAELKNLAVQTGATESNLQERMEGLRTWITEYATAKAEEQRITEEALKKERDAIMQSRTSTVLPTGNTVYSELSKAQQARVDEIDSILAVTEAYQRGADNIISTWVAAQEKALTAEANALQSAQRAATTTNSLIAKETDKAEREAEKSGEKVGDKVLEGIKKSFGKSGLSKDIADATERSGSIGVVMPLALDVELKEGLKAGASKLSSPIATKLKLSESDIAIIEQQALSAAGQIFNSIAQLSQQATQRRLDNQLDAIEREADSEKAILEGKLEQGVISQEEYEKKLAELDEETAARKEAANKEAFEKQKKWNIGQALMNAALAITNIWATHAANPIMAGILTAITAATTAAEIAVIASQKYARGGELRGPSHAQGGIKGFVGNRHIEAEGGEIIINKRSSAKHRKLLSLINSDNGWGDDFASARGGSGHYFARGGVLGGYDFRPAPLPDTSGGLARFAQQQTANIESAISAINRRIDNLRVSLLLSDLETKSNEKRVHVSRASL